MNPVIVIGAPFSGTSVVTRLLQTELDVMMDEGPIRCDQYKPSGYYEDHRIYEINKIAQAYHLERYGQKNKNVPLEWADKFMGWLMHRSKKYSLWGWKEISAGLLKHQKKFLQNPLYIVCKRDDKKVIKSQIKKKGFPKKVAIQGLKAYKNVIRRDVGDHGKYIDLSNYKPESQIVETLSGFIEQWQYQLSK